MTAHRIATRAGTALLALSLVGAAACSSGSSSTATSTGSTSGSSAPRPVGARDDLATIPPGSSAPTRRGSLDPSFATDGVATGNDGNLFAVRTLPDGKVLVAGTNGGGYQSLLRRYDADGAPDTTFGPEGIVNPPGGQAVWSITVSSTGAITGLTSDGDQFGLFRLRPDGTPDTTFGCTTPPCAGYSAQGGTGLARDMAELPDGSFVVVWRDMKDTRFGVVKFGANGLPDPSFTPPEIDGWSESVAVNDGKIVVAGSAEVNGTGRFRVVQYLPDGSLDATFGCPAGTGCTGIVDGPDGPRPGDENVKPNLSVTTDPATGDILVAGTAGDVSPTLTAFRLDQQGLDQKAYERGPTGLTNGLNAAVVTTDHILVVGGTTTNGNGPRWVLIAYDAAGRIIPGFGCTTGDCGGPADLIGSAFAVDVDAEGRLLVAGNGIDVAESSPSQVLTRFTPPA